MSPPCLQGTKTRQRQTELRTQVAHVFRMIADHLRPGSLRTEPLLRNRVLEFVADTVKVLTASAAGVRRQLMQSVRQHSTHKMFSQAPALVPSLPHEA